MGAPLGIGQAVLGFVDSERQRRDLLSAANGAAQMFDSIGTDNSKQYAQMLRSDPRGAFAMAESVGGLKQLITMEQANASRQRVATATAGQEVGSQEYLNRLGAGLVAEGEPGTGIQAFNLARPDAVEAGIPPDLLAGIAKMSPQEQWDTLVASGVVPEKAAQIIKNLRPPQPRTTRSTRFNRDTGEFEIIEGPNVSPSVVKRAETQAMRAQNLRNAIDLYPIIRENPSLQARGAEAQTLAKGVGVIAPRAAAHVRRFFTEDASPYDMALFNNTVERMKGSAARLLNGGGGQLSEGDAKRGALMTSAASDPETFQEAVRAQIIAEVRAPNYEARNTGEQPDYDIRSDADMIRLRDELKKEGFTKEEVAAILKDVTETMPGWLE